MLTHLRCFAMAVVAMAAIVFSIPSSAAFASGGHTDTDDSRPLSHLSDAELIDMLGVSLAQMESVGREPLNPSPLAEPGQSKEELARSLARQIGLMPKADAPLPEPEPERGLFDNPAVWIIAAVVGAIIGLVLAAMAIEALLTVGLAVLAGAWTLPFGLGFLILLVVLFIAGLWPLALLLGAAMAGWGFWQMSRS